MKSLEQVLTEQHDEIRDLRKQLAERGERPRVKKHLGEADNGSHREDLNESVRAESEKKKVDNLVECFELMGLSRKEAEIASEPVAISRDGRDLLSLLESK